MYFAQFPTIFYDAVGNTESQDSYASAQTCGSTQ